MYQNNIINIKLFKNDCCDKYNLDIDNLKEECNILYNKLYNIKNDDEDCYDKLILYKEILKKCELIGGYDKWDIELKSVITSICDNYIFLVYNLLTHHFNFYSWYLKDKDGKIEFTYNNLKYPLQDEIIKVNNEILTYLLESKNLFRPYKILYKRLIIIKRYFTEINEDLNKYLTKYYIKKLRFIELL